MKNLISVYPVVLMFVLTVNSVLLLDEAVSETSRWGVTTRKSLEKAPNTPLENPGSEAVPVKPAQEANPADTAIRSDAGDTQPEEDRQNSGTSKNPEKTEHPASVKPNAETGKLKSVASPLQQNSLDEKKPAPAAGHAKTATNVTAWADEQQKKTCQTHLAGLRELFLKTRHYSIQGAACNTNESASAFLKLRETCKQDCPEGFLKQNGYTERIIRNITYLEKLGQDRCAGTNPPPESPRTQ